MAAFRTLTDFMNDTQRQPGQRRTFPLTIVQEQTNKFWNAYNRDFNIQCPQLIHNPVPTLLVHADLALKCLTIELWCLPRSAPGLFLIHICNPHMASTWTRILGCSIHEALFFHRVPPNTYSRSRQPLCTVKTADVTKRAQRIHLCVSY
jgi:hypothetical protein